MPRIDVPEGMRPLSRLDELAPSLRKAMKEFRRVTLDETSLPFSEIEVIRLRCAQLNGCRTCFSYRMERDDPERAARAGGRLTPEFYAAVLGDGDLEVLTEREQLLRELCERFYFDHFSLDDDEPFWARVRAAFDDAEIAGATITLMSFGMSARLNRVLGIDGVSENGDVCVVPLEPVRVETSAA